MNAGKNQNKVTPSEGGGGEETTLEKKEQNAEATVSRKEKTMQFVNSKSLNIAMAIFTVFALFGDDFRLIFFTIDADPVFYTMSCIALSAFLLEVGLNTYAKPDYVWSFYFYLDLISTVSVIPDIAWIWDPLTGSDGGSNQIAFIKAGRASRAGTRAGRIVRIVRLVRMVRIVKLFKAKSNQDNVVVVEISEPSKVGKILTELTIRRLIILVLVMIIVLPLIDGVLEENNDEYQQFGLQDLHRYPQDFNASGSLSNDLFRNMAQMYARNAGFLLSMKLTGLDEAITNQWMKDMRFQPWDPSEQSWIATEPFSLETNPFNDWHYDDLIPDVPSKYRKSEYTLVESLGCYTNGKCTDCASSLDASASQSSCRSVVYFNTRSKSQSDAFTNIMKTLFIMFVLSVGAIMFTSDAQKLVIGPIERMMALVKKLAENPLGNTQTQRNPYDTDEVKGDYETAMLEQTLSKIGGLLQVGFGAAGAEIIAKNMGGAGELNVMIPGKKITSIFGFGIIEHFTETCSALEEEIITYINTIAFIVHSNTNLYYGAANKNIGAAFLLAWKICDGTLPGLRDPRDPADERRMDSKTKMEKRKGIHTKSLGGGSKVREITPQEVVDSALTAVLKMRIDLHNANQKPNGKFRSFCDKKRIVETFGSNFEVHLGFGLHIGWAIEGAIGSKFKVDASYLSPNVNMAARLEAATGQFEVPMLISEWFVDELSPAAMKYCRKVDRVTVKGSAIPMQLWTFDIGYYPPEGFTPKIGEDGLQKRVDFENDEIYKTLQQQIPRQFFEEFNSGFTSYIDGKWSIAKEKFDICATLLPDDGPTHVLLKVLESYHNTAPGDWKGFRPLTEK